MESVPSLTAPPPEPPPAAGLLLLPLRASLHPLHSEGDTVLLLSPSRPDLQDQGGRRQHLQVKTELRVHGRAGQFRSISGLV